MKSFVICALLATAASALPEAAKKPVYEFLGRVNPATRELTWPATGIRFGFTGTSASVPVTNQVGSNAFQLIIDGKAPIIIDNVNGSSISTPPGLKHGAHTFELRRKNEVIYGSLNLGEPTSNGKITAFPKPPKRRIEIIGDSISVGYGLGGLLPCVNSAQLEDGPRTYGALTANNLTADYSIVAWSGKGIIRNYCSGVPDTEPIMPAIWTRYGANDADNSYDFKTPVDVVVINLGTNDLGYLNCREPLDIGNYTTAMVAFAKTVQKKYKKADFFFTSSPMVSDSWPAGDNTHTVQVAALKNVTALFGPKGHFVNFPPQGPVVGCDYHPTGQTHAELAVILTNAIKQVKGW